MRKILIVDDHRLFLDGMSQLLKRLGDDIEVCECDDVQSAIKRIDCGEYFTLALVDLAMPGLDGFAFLRSLKERRIVCPVVVVSACVDPADIRRALSLGALGFIPKNSNSDDMLTGLRKVLGGDVYLPGELWHLISDRSLPEVDDNPSFQLLSIKGIGKRQLQVLELMKQGLANKTIASVLDVSEATVKYHIGILFRALDVNSRTACVHKAQQQGIFNSE